MVAVVVWEAPLWLGGRTHHALLFFGFLKNGRLLCRLVTRRTVWQDDHALKAGAAASAARIIATVNNSSMRLNALPPLTRRVEGCTTGSLRLIGALRSGRSS